MVHGTGYVDRQLTSFIYTVSVTWSGTTVNGPVLLYHNEIPRGGSNGLLCQSSENTGVAWHLTDGTTVRTATGFTLIQHSYIWFLPKYIFYKDVSLA